MSRAASATALQRTALKYPSRRISCPQSSAASPTVCKPSIHPVICRIHTTAGLLAHQGALGALCSASSLVNSDTRFASSELVAGVGSFESVCTAVAESKMSNPVGSAASFVCLSWHPFRISKLTSYAGCLVGRLEPQAGQGPLCTHRLLLRLALRRLGGPWAAP